MLSNDNFQSDSSSLVSDIQQREDFKVFKSFIVSWIFRRFLPYSLWRRPHDVLLLCGVNYEDLQSLNVRELVRKSKINRGDTIPSFEPNIALALLVQCTVYSTVQCCVALCTIPHHRTEHGNVLKLFLLLYPAQVRTRLMLSETQISTF